MTVVGNDPNDAAGTTGAYARGDGRCGGATSSDGWKTKLGKRNTYRYFNRSGVMPDPGDGGGACSGNANGVHNIKIQDRGDEYRYVVKIRNATLGNVPIVSGNSVVGTLQAQVSLGHSDGTIGDASPEGKVGQCADAQFKAGAGCTVSKGTRITCK